MIEAFELGLKQRILVHNIFLGGDFHSRTCLSMYPEIKKEVDDGLLLIEWDKSKGKAPVP